MPLTPEEKQEAEKKKFHFSKHILLGIGLVLVIASMISGIVIMQSQDVKGIPIRLRVAQQPTPVLPTDIPPTNQVDPTAHWKTYANKSFSIKYPDRFKVEERKTVPSQLYSKIHASVIFTDADTAITITVAKNTQNYTLENALGNGPSLRYAKSLMTGKKVRNISVDNTNAVMIEDISAGQNGTARDLVMIKDNKMYQLTLAPQQADVTTFMHMATTFKMLHQEPVDETDSWKLHTNTTYGYQFRYPLTYALDFNKVASGTPTLVIAYDNTKVQVDMPKFKIEVQDAKNFGQSAITSREILKLKLDEYVIKKWDYNKAATDAAIVNRRISAIKTTTVDGKPAYSFTVSGKYIDDHVAEILQEEYIFIFTESGGYKFKIWFPTSSLIYNQIFNTVTFTR